MKNRPSRCSLLNPSLGPRPSRPVFSLPKPLPQPSKPASPAPGAKLADTLAKQVEFRIACEQKDPQLVRPEGYLSSSGTLLIQSAKYPEELVAAHEGSKEDPLVLKGVIEPLLSLYVTL
jgi:hypothetical protein